MRCFFSLSSTSVAAPTLSTATPPDSLASRSWSFSRSKSLGRVLDLELDLPDAGLDRAPRSPCPRRSWSCPWWRSRDAPRRDPRAATLSSLRPTSSEMTRAPVRVAMSSSIALRRSPKPGALTASTLIVPRSLLTTRVGSASPSTSSAMMSSGRPAGDDLLEGRQDVRHRADLLVGDEHVRLVERGLHAAAVGGRDQVGAEVAAVELHALDVLLVELEPLALLDGDHAVLADLLHHLRDQVADLGVARADGRDVGDVVLGLDRLREVLDLVDDGRDAAARCRA